MAYATKNWIMVNMFYGKMSYQELEEELTYDFFDMIGKWHKKKVQYFC